MKSSILFNARGLSFIELMVVVAIMAILATVAIPSYQGFQAKARQKEGFGLLNTYYSAAHNARAEFGWFPGNFVQTGFQPVGEIGYRLQADDGQDVNIAINDNACTSTAAACDCAGQCSNFRIWTEAPLGTPGASRGVSPATGACGTLSTPTVTNTTFVVQVGAVISTRSGQPDRYGMDHMKTLVMCSDGLM